MDNTNIYVQLLSAGVIAAIIEGIFSIVIAIKNNKLIKQQSEETKKFEIRKMQYEPRPKAYDNLLQMLPEEKRISHAFANLHINAGITKDEIEEGMEKIGELAPKEEMILINHFKNYDYLLTTSQKDALNKIIEEHDSLSEEYNPMYLAKIAEFEEIYCDCIKTRLLELAK